MSINNEEFDFPEENDLKKKTDTNYLDDNTINQSDSSKSIEISFSSGKSSTHNQKLPSRRSSLFNSKTLFNTRQNSNLNDINSDKENEKNMPFFLKSSFNPTKRKSKINWRNDYNQFKLNDTESENSIRSLIKRGSLKMPIKDKDYKIQILRNKNKIYSNHSSKNNIKIINNIENYDDKLVKYSNINNINVGKNSSQIQRTKFILLNEVKNLLDEIKNEKNKSETNKKKSKKFKDTSHLFLQRNVTPQIPFLKERFQINNYLINDFKEKESIQDYIKRSLKYRAINDNYESEQQKKLEENYNKQEIIDQPIIRIPTKKISEYSCISKSNFGKKIQSTINMPIYINNNNNISIASKKKKINSKNDEDSFSIDNSKNNDNIKRNKNKKNTTINIPIKYNFYPNFRNSNKKKDTKKLSPKRNNNLRYFDKYTISNNSYKDHKRNYSEYQMKKRKMRSENFSIQMSNLEKDKHLFMTEGDEDSTLPKLKENKLLYLIQYKNVFKNSFNSMTAFKNEDQDLGFDNLEKFKKSILDTEIEMIALLKNENHPNYIKNNFSKKTNKKYRSTRGVFFGA